MSVVKPYDVLRDLVNENKPQPETAVSADANILYFYLGIGFMAVADGLRAIADAIYAVARRS